MSQPPTQSQLEFRNKYRAYVPWGLALVRADKLKFYEFTSYPWPDPDGKVLIMARPIGDATENRPYEVRKAISPCRWGTLRQRAYREGFKGGYGYAVEEGRKFHA